jgi:hypothetical protein
MSEKFRRYLSLYAAVLSTVVAATALTGAASTKAKGAFDELTVRRINVVEPNGVLRIVISDHAKLPGIIVRGKEQAFARPQAGMLFYNDDGSETGGLIFGGRRNAKGEVVDAGGSLSFDRYEANQIVQLIGVDDKEDRFAGLVVSDSPTGTEVHRRAWIGRNDDGTASLELRDARGRRRLVLEVSGEGAAKVQFLDEKGTVVNELTPNLPR